MLVAFAVIPNKLESALAGSGPHVDYAGQAGTATGLPSTPSQTTITENEAAGPGSPFAGLSVTVNQTQNLVNQDISVSWSGADATISGSPGDFNGDYLQIFECWGDPESVYPNDADDPGPPPSQCEFGGESSTPTTSYPIQNLGYEYSRVLSQSGWPTDSALQACTGTSSTSTCTLPGYTDLYADTRDGFVIEPFDAVDGPPSGNRPIMHTTRVSAIRNRFG